MGGLQSPSLADLPPVERDRIQERHQDLLQVKTGSRIGDPDGDRASGRLSVDYDPQRTTLMERYERKHLELAARHIPHSSVSTLRRQQRTVEGGGMEALIHGNRRLIGRRLEGVSDRVLAVVTEALQQEPDLAKISDRALVDKARAALLRAGVEDELTRYKLGAIVPS